MSILEKKKLEEAEASQKCVLLCKDNLCWSLIMSPNWLGWLHFLIQTHVKNAEKYLKTSPLKLKFTPDWDPAGDEFSRAATAYKVLNIFQVGFKVGKEELWTKLISQRPGCKEVRRVEEMFTSCRWLLQRNTQHFPSGLINMIMMQKTITWLLAFSWGKL